MQHLAHTQAMEGKGLVAELQRAATCPACRGHFKDPVILDCDHSYCRACITRYWEEATANGRVISCPHCKKVFERKNLRTNVKLAVEVKITQHLNAKTAEVPFAPKPRRRRGWWTPAASLQKEKASEKSADASVMPAASAKLSHVDTLETQPHPPLNGPWFAKTCWLQQQQQNGPKKSPPVPAAKQMHPDPGRGWRG
nr:PREDICTED: RING finger protein 39 isoform X1 [Anolis carolinensis]|eukprot:XP_008103831.1 PREDICTED: RING finger protein 39 isoform X1 [Anolis carolinensis]